MERGIAQIKPIYIGIRHYRDVYGSVCSADVIGTPPISPPTREEPEASTRAMVEGFEESSLGQVDQPQVNGLGDDASVEDCFQNALGSREPALVKAPL